MSAYQDICCHLYILRSDVPSLYVGNLRMSMTLLAYLRILYLLFSDTPEINTGVYQDVQIGLSL